MAHDYTHDNEAPSTSLVRQPVQMPARQAEEDGLSLGDQFLTKIATKPVLKKQDKILRASVDLSEIDILPTGEVYMSHVYIRRRLNDAFLPMGWALRPMKAIQVNSEISQMIREYALIAAGRVVAMAYGSAKYYPKTRKGENNPRADFADTAEIVRSNALTRCAKDLGIGSECWDRRWCEAWKQKNAVHVWVVEKKWGSEENQTNAYWRRIDAEPFRNEIKPVEDSPNQEAWRQQASAWSEMLRQETKKTKEAVENLRAARLELVKARHELTAEKKPASAPAAAPAPPVQQENAAARQAKERETKPAGTVQGSRPATAHAPSAVNTSDRPFLIRNVERKKTERSPWKIVMMDGSEFWTFSQRVHDEMQLHFAARDKIKIESEAHNVDGKRFNHVLEWIVIATGEKKQK